MMSMMAELTDSPLASYITLDAKNCGYSGTAEELITQAMFIPCF